jgi:protein gp37
VSRALFPLPVAAEVRPAEDLAELAAAINADHEAGEAATRKGLERFRAAGEKLTRAKAQCGHGKWLPWLKKNVQFEVRTAQTYMRVASEWDKCATAAHLRDALRLLTEDAADVGGDEDDTPPLLPKYVTLDQWTEAGERVRKHLLAAESADTFNDQGNNTGIEWALWSWNPVTGCRHNCPYCYARDFANRLYDQKFVPSLIPGKLKAPRNTPYPGEKIKAEPEGSWRRRALGNVFTCSMADLFGRWVPSEWIEAVLSEVRTASQWNFLFLTKFPVRMAEFDFPENAWVGTTVDCQARVANAEKSFRKVKAGVKWLSIEPLIEPLKFTDIGAFQWLVIGGASRSSLTPEWHPPARWVSDIESVAAKAGVPFYEKDNLRGRVRQYPGDVPHVDPTTAPEALRYLPGAS